MVRFRDSYLFARKAWALAAVLAGLALLGLLLRSADRRRSLAEHGVTTTGRVVDRRISEGKSTAYNVAVEYETPGGRQGRQMTVSATTYASAEIGGSLPVVYDSTDPQNVRLRRPSQEDVADYATKWGIGWIVGAGLVWLCFHVDAGNAREQRRKLSEWPVASMTVERVEAEGSKSESLKASGWYLDGAGRRVEAKGVKVGKSVRLGKPVAILYDPASDEILSLDSLNNVEVEAG